MLLRFCRESFPTVHFEKIKGRNASEALGEHFQLATYRGKLTITLTVEALEETAKSSRFSTQQLIRVSKSFPVIDPDQNDYIQWVPPEEKHRPPSSSTTMENTVKTQFGSKDAFCQNRTGNLEAETKVSCSEGIPPLCRPQWLAMSPKAREAY